MNNFRRNFRVSHCYSNCKHIFSFIEIPKRFLREIIIKFICIYVYLI